MEKNNHYSRKLIIIIDCIILAVLVFADQFIKNIVVNKLKGNDAFVLIPNVLEFDYLENRGSAFGMLQNQKIFILLVGFIFMALIVFILFKLPLKKKFIPANVFFAMVVAGGIGNMIDRFRLDYVVDFISFVLIHFPIFNFADCCVVIGVIGLFIMFLFVYKENDLEFLKFKQNRYRDMDK
ncbi:MAG: signal peptidase II [Lachnospiraceae bacterium]|nr:signal peptidase II [Lachnospiraceae bacterium]